MQMSVVAALMIITTVLLSACEQQPMASVEDRSSQYYGRSGQMMAGGYHYGTHQAVAVDSISTASLAAPAPSYAPAASYTTGPIPFGRGTPAPVTHVSSASPAPFASPAPAETMTTAFGNKVAVAAPVASFHSSEAAFPSAMASNWAWPVQGSVTERFGKQANGIANEGITIAAADGAPIRAASGGEVAYVGSHVRDYGNMVIVRHSGGALTSYAHAKEILVSKGDKVIQGDVLGYVGQTGTAKSPQLHFAMREGSHAVDPMSKLPSQLASR